MKHQLSVIALSIILTACGESGGSDNHGDTAPTPKPSFTPVYDLSKISKGCADGHSEVVNTTPDVNGIKGIVAYMYQPENKCSPEGDVPAFLMNDSLDTVVSYVQDIDGVTYEYQYIDLNDKDLGAVGSGSLPAYSTPVWANISGSNAKGTYEIVVDLRNSRKILYQGGTTTVYGSYTRGDFVAEFPKQMHHETALNLFKLSNNQKPDL